MAIATKKFDDRIIDLINELIEGQLIDEPDLMQLAYRTEKLDEDTYIKLSRTFFKFFKNPLKGFRSGLYDPEHYTDPLLFFHSYLPDHKAIIPQLKNLLFEILTHFKNIEGRLKSLSRYWRDILVLFVKECPIVMEPILNLILDNLDKFPLQYPDVEFVVSEFLKISPNTVLKALERLFEEEYKDYRMIQFIFSYRLIINLPEEFLIDICKKDTEKIVPLFGKLLQKLLLTSESLPDIVKVLLRNFPENEDLKYELIYSFITGTKVFTPGTEGVYETEALRKLKRWKTVEEEDIIQKWIDEAIISMQRRFEESRMRDEEMARDHEERNIEFYERYTWLNEIRDEYVGQTIAYFKDDDEWKILYHSNDENQVYKEVNKKYENNEISKNLKVYFKSFGDE